MEPNLNSDEDNRRFNGQTVTSILATLGHSATAENICNEIAHMTDQPMEIIEPEVKSILQRGISHGFLVRFGKHYLLSGQDEGMEVDSESKSYKNVGRRAIKRKATDSINDDRYRFYGNIALNLEQTDGASKNNHYVAVRLNEAVNAILDDLQEEIQTPEYSSEEETHFIDLGGIITRNLKKLSIYMPPEIQLVRNERISKL